MCALGLESKASQFKALRFWDCGFRASVGVLGFRIEYLMIP